jgi:hypothetical protein
MTMVLELTAEQKERLHYYATSRGLTDESALVQLVEALPKPKPKTETPDKIPPPFPNLVAYMAPDFDDPLPDEFWQGDEANDPLYSSIPIRSSGGIKTLTAYLQRSRRY